MTRHGMTRPGASQSSGTKLLKNAAFPGREGLYDVVIRDGVVDSILPARTGSSTSSAAGEPHDLGGRFLIPGLWDHHVHFSQWVTQRQRLDLSATSSAAEVVGLVYETLVSGRRARDASVLATPALPKAAQPLVGYGFRDGLWPDLPSVEALDEATGGTPVVLISGDLHCGWLNTAAARMLTAEPDSSGLVREDPWFSALERLDSLVPQLSMATYQEAARAAARRGVVGVVEFENADNITAWPERAAQGVDSLRVEVSVWPDKLDGALHRGLKTGDPLDESGLITMGPLKVVVDGSLNTRTAWCWEPYPGLDSSHPHACGMETVPIEELEALLRSARDGGLAAAIHAIGDRANTAVLDTFETLGMTGVIEHAQLVREQDFGRFARLGLAASVQPEHAMDDRDVADRYWEGRTGRAFALRSLHEAGVPLYLGSDAPVSPLDPWVAMAAAVSRSRDGRDSWHPEQRIPADLALASSARGRAGVEIGDLADLAVVERDPLAVSGDELRTMPVAATVMGGRFTYNRL